MTTAPSLDENYAPFTPDGAEDSSVTNVRGLLAFYYFF
jgi:hypothetical protein